MTLNAISPADRVIECGDCKGQGFGFTPKYWICHRCAGWGVVDPVKEAEYAAAAELAENE